MYFDHKKKIHWPYVMIHTLDLNKTGASTLAECYAGAESIKRKEK